PSIAVRPGERKRSARGLSVGRVSPRLQTKRKMAPIGSGAISPPVLVCRLVSRGQEDLLVRGRDFGDDRRALPQTWPAPAIRPILRVDWHLDLRELCLLRRSLQCGR